MKIKFIIPLCLFAFIKSNAQTNQHRLDLNCFDEDSNAVTDYYSKIITGDSTQFTLNKESYNLQKGRCILVVSKFGYYERRDTINLSDNLTLRIVLKEKAIEQSGFIAKASRVDKNNAFTYTNISGKELKLQNLGQDLTYLIGNTPSSVATSDAGAGVGYTGIRIRGSDATRINVTINGIPINDAESHGVFWVNMPDLASSTNSVQVQRGVGTSTNGNGSFGANISINNIENSEQPGLQLQQSYGSFNTFKSTLKFATGRIGNFTFNGRLSKIMSDGYIDRASSDLSSFQFNLNYYKNKWAINAVCFGGKEKTYQAWSGTPQSRYENDNEGMQEYIPRAYPPLTPAQAENLLTSGRTYNYFTYKNQTDNYKQNHYQLHIGKEIGKHLLFKSSFFTTTGQGYFEEYKTDDSLKYYGVAQYDTFKSTDLVRQKWLDNVYFGNFTTLDYSKNKLKVNAGIGLTSYQGKSFGKVIWATVAQAFGTNDYEYYSSKSTKNEVNGFVKAGYQVDEQLNLIAELQVRDIHYKSDGTGSDLKPVKFDQHYTFFNPKVGLNYNFTKNQQVYTSLSIGNREPVRSDFTDNTDSTLPKPERLRDFEIGYIKRGKYHFIQLNAYFMNYTDQLVLTGAVNDVGTPLRKNVAASSREGIELIGMKSFFRGKTIVEGNLTLSQNKIKNFKDEYYNWDSMRNELVYHAATDISFSPGVIGYFGVTDKHFRNFEIGVNLKYVGKQYLDNTSDNNAKIDPYTTLNLHFMKEFKFKNASTLIFKGLVNNLLSMNYTNNGWTYKYVSGGKMINENFYYTQSLINFLVGVEMKF